MLSIRFQALSHQVMLRTVGLAALTMAFFSASVHAEAPKQVKNQVPGFYRMMVGDLEVTALYDGQIEIDTKLLKNIWLRCFYLQHLVCKQQ